MLVLRERTLNCDGWFQGPLLPRPPRGTCRRTPLPGHGLWRGIPPSAGSTSQLSGTPRVSSTPGSVTPQVGGQVSVPVLPRWHSPHGPQADRQVAAFLKHPHRFASFWCDTFGKLRSSLCRLATTSQLPICRFNTRAAACATKSFNSLRAVGGVGNTESKVPRQTVTPVVTTSQPRQGTTGPSRRSHDGLGGRQTRPQPDNTRPKPRRLSDNRVPVS